MPRLPTNIQYAFTLNNYDEEEYAHICAQAQVQAKYWICGKEVSPSGTPHLQGYLLLRRRHNLRDVRNLFGPRIHFEGARGSPQQNRSYCSKDGNFTEGGDIPTGVTKPKSRDELARKFATHIRRGTDGLAEFADTEPGTWYYSGHNLLRNALTLCRPISRPDVSVLWIHGLPGTGKSRKAHEDMPNAYIKEPRTKWWNGYLLEDEVIIDDFGPNGIDINHLLRWFDRYKCNVENKGGMIPLHATKFIVTSNFRPEDCFRDKDNVLHPQTDALLRRLSIQEL